MYAELEGNRLIEKIRRGDRVLGMMVSSLDPAITDILGASGFDFVVLDNEASPMTMETALGHVRAAEARGIPALARVIENSRILIRQFLDIGCRGIVVPHLETAAEAERAVAATRFAPQGVRGMCPSCHAAAYSPPGVDTWHRWHDEDSAGILTIPLIESQRGVENAGEILDVEGVEVVLFGPGDFSQDVGAHGPAGTARVVEAWHVVVREAKKRSKYVLGFPYPDPTVEASARLYEDGADGVIHFMDLLLFHGLARTIEAVRPRSAESP